MQSALKYGMWFLLAIIGAVITFYVFGVELPVYLILGTTGLYFYIYSKNPFVKLFSGWIGRISIVLFIISLFYYFGTNTFFPDNPVNFRFLSVGIAFINEQSERLGEIVLNLIG
ncbi:MAG: hypothetical protein HYW24_01540 [Candidatus Aenigmarchaeota archaeon]|nr:hypothetical protein [Candidatus Aenigmarchaeota archaeon]